MIKKKLLIENYITKVRAPEWSSLIIGYKEYKYCWWKLCTTGNDIILPTKNFALALMREEKRKHLDISPLSWITNNIVKWAIEKYKENPEGDFIKLRNIHKCYLINEILNLLRNDLVLTLHPDNKLNNIYKEIMQPIIKDFSESYNMKLNFINNYYFDKYDVDIDISYKLKKKLCMLNMWELIALNTICQWLNSCILGINLFDKKHNIKYVQNIANIERNYQCQTWGILPQHKIDDKIEYLWLKSAILLKSLCSPSKINIDKNVTN
ncbi:hypothetical protein ACR3K2_28690 [Cryptosporidium serpentis]